MASLYKRATKEQQQMLRIIAGAVRNAAHAHGITLEKNFARSVAKRAVGTLTAMAPRSLGSKMPDVLATPLGDGHEGEVAAVTAPSA